MVARFGCGIFLDGETGCLRRGPAPLGSRLRGNDGRVRGNDVEGFAGMTVCFVFLWVPAYAGKTGWFRFAKGMLFFCGVRLLVVLRV